MCYKVVDMLFIKLLYLTLIERLECSKITSVLLQSDKLIKKDEETKKKAVLRAPLSGQWGEIRQIGLWINNGGPQQK